jgi:hypothetical protein
MDFFGGGGGDKGSIRTRHHPMMLLKVAFDKTGFLKFKINNNFKL